MSELYCPSNYFVSQILFYLFNVYILETAIRIIFFFLGEKVSDDEIVAKSNLVKVCQPTSDFRVFKSETGRCHLSCV